MEEDKKTIVLNKDEKEADAGQNDSPGGVTDETIEYTLLAHEIPELAEQNGQPVQKENQAEKGREQKASEERRTRYGLPVDRPETKELAGRMEERRLYYRNKKRRFRIRFYAGVTSAALIITAAVLSVSGIFTVDSIEVKGNTHYSAEEIINMGHAVPGRNLIYQANKEEIKEYLEQNPYISTAAVSRKFPSTLVIKVTERTERLAFGYDDDYLIMDENGILLKKTRNEPKVTVVEGLVVNRIKLGEKIGTEEKRRFNSVLDIIRSMIKSDLYFVKLDVSDRKKVKAYVYDNLVVKTDYDTLLTNMENGKLHVVLEKIFAEGIERGTITFGEDGSASFQPGI